VHSDEVEASWALFDPVVRRPREVPPYAADSREKAGRMIEPGPAQQHGLSPARQVRSGALPSGSTSRNIPA
jgi:hypothetical protein